MSLTRCRGTLRAAVSPNGEIAMFFVIEIRVYPHGFGALDKPYRLLSGPSPGCSLCSINIERQVSRFQPENDARSEGSPSLSPHSALSSPGLFFRLLRLPGPELILHRAYSWFQSSGVTPFSVPTFLRSPPIAAIAAPRAVVMNVIKRFPPMGWLAGHSGKDHLERLRFSPRGNQNTTDQNVP